MKVVFAHPDFEYGSYHYFRRLVELSGFDSCPVSRMDMGAEGTVYVTSPANHALWEKLAPLRSQNIRAKVIYWNLERPDVPPKRIEDLVTTEVHADTRSVLALPGVVAAWVSDRYQASLDPNHLHVVLGSSEKLAEGGPLAMAWDLCHFSYVWGRRGEVMARLSQKFKVAPPDIHPSARAHVLRASRAIVSIHQTPSPVLEVLRSAWSAAYRLPLVCETIKDPWPMVPGEHFLEFDYATLPDELVPWIRQEGLREQLRLQGERRYELLCKTHNFRDSVLDGVRRTLA